MKNVFLLLLALSIGLMAHAGGYNYLVFTNQAGTTTAFEVSNLTLKVNGSDLHVSNTDETLSFVLTDLKSMQFSEDKTATGVEDVLNADGPVQVYSVTGTLMGTYNSVVDAAKCLNAGTYVISNGSVKQTIVVK